MGMGSEKYLTAIRIQKMVMQYLTNKKNELKHKCIIQKKNEMKAKPNIRLLVPEYS